MLPKNLLKDVRDGRVIPLVGSGVSLSINPGLLPSWPGLLNKLADRLAELARPDEAELVRIQAKLNMLLDSANSAFKALGPAEFYKVLRAAIDVDCPPDADLSLPRAIWALQPAIVVTTNYDDVLQWAHPEPKPPIVTNRQTAELARLYRDADRTRPVVWHLHGHIRDADSLILAPGQYETFYTRAAERKGQFRAALQQLHNAVANYSFLFVGFGMSDPYVMGLLGEVLDSFGGNLEGSFALLRRGERDAQQLWTEHRVRVLEFPEYGQSVVDLLHEIAAQSAALSPSYAPGPPAAATPRRVLIPQGYLDWLQARCVDINLLGMRIKDAQGLRLNRVYVPLTTPRQAEARVPERKRRGARESDPADHDAPPQLLLELLGRQSLYVSGNPGSGKSTFCRWVAYLACSRSIPPADVAAPKEFREQLPEDFRRRLPLLVPLREFWQHLRAPDPPDPPGCELLSRALGSWIAASGAEGLDAQDLAAHLTGGSMLILLDGVDEVPLSETRAGRQWSPRQRLLDCLEQALPVWQRTGHRVLITSRPYGLDERQVRQLGIPHAPIEQLAEQMQQLLAGRLFALLAGQVEQGQALADAMLAHLRQLQGLEPLAANPLLLTAICIIYNEGKRLPQDKYDLYDRIVETVLFRRYPNDPNVVELVRGRLAVVALQMHTGEALGERRSNPQAEATVEQLDAILGEFRQRSPETEAALRDTVQAREDLLSRSGLLLPRVSDGGTRQAAFYHLSIQEFLAGERLVKSNPGIDSLVELYRRRAGSASWRNTLSFAFGCLVSRISWEVGRDLLQRLLDELHWPRLAETLEPARAALDGLEILRGRSLQLQPELVQRFRELCLAAIEQEVDLPARVEFGLALGRLGDPRIVADLRDHEDPQAWVAIEPGSYTIGGGESFDLEPLKKQKYQIPAGLKFSRYPVTNAQFAEFVRCGGYGDRQRWSAAGWQWKEREQAAEPLYWRDPRWNGPNQPVVGVSFWEAEAFCSWAGGRLPTEREWEAAARGPKGFEYPWGDDWRDGICNTLESGLNRTSPVGLFPSSRSAAFQLEDAAGNVWEWCSDEVQSKTWGVCRVLRGGSWLNLRDLAGCGYRYWWLPDDRDNVVGFRLCCVFSPGLAVNR